ncbi:hypothetical protein CHS0354_035405 [Potamilus streckersoni]|uniref:Uncharacterized protein n=1 Tax=Potamilus streckersoni TaxID=2493646 RepID=A0AAE0TDH5_9BIVA|nr:hypothetical protein CHS0354_035405 [Potamilus streckersoni]
MRGQLVTSNTMSWKGSGQGQLADANVPDYEKMLHSRYAGSSTGWSSSLNSQYGYPTYSPRSSSGSYMSPSSHRGAYREPRPRSAYLQYQPSKYGLSSELSRYSSLSNLGADFRQLGLESNSYNHVPENGYESESAYRPKPRSGVLNEMNYDFVNQTRPGTDNIGYASDSGSHHHRRYRQHSRDQDSGEFDLETPYMLSNSPPKSPIGDRSLDKSNSDMYMSPTKSQVSMSDFYRYRNDSANSTDMANLNTVSHDDYFKSPPIAKERSVSSNISSHNSIGDLTRWQQHQKQRMNPDEPESEADVSREKIEKSNDLPSNRSHENKALNSHVVQQRERKVPISQPYMLQESQDTYDLQERKSDQLETFKNAANAIIQDKDSIIEKQKLRIMDLEETTKEYEMRLRRTLQYSAAPETGDNNRFTKLQELEYKNAALRTELKELKTRKDEEVEALEIKLGGVEHELVQMQTVLRNNQPDMEKIGAKLHEKELEAEEWKNKFMEMKQSHQGLKQKLDGVERYLADLPTAEEFSKNAEEISFLGRKQLVLIYLMHNRT